ATAMEAVRRVKRRHASVRGTDPVTGREYSADDPDTQVWVHITEWHSFLAAYRVFAGGLSPDDEDRYIREGTIIGSLLGTPRERARRRRPRRRPAAPGDRERPRRAESVRAGDRPPDAGAPLEPFQSAAQPSRLTSDVCCLTVE